MKEAIQKIIDQYKSQIKFADHDAASYFRQFIAKLEQVILQETSYNVYLIMGNDFPNSVWSTEEKANNEIERLKRQDEERLKNLIRSGPKVYFRSSKFEVQ